jgi:hypothetical protein
MSKRGRKHRDIVEDLEAQGKHLEAFLLAWSIIELHCDNILLRAYGLSTHNPKSQWLTEMRISSKLRLLNLMELVSDKEFGVIQQFKRTRDSLAHRDGLFFPNYTEAQKTKLIDMACAAANITHDLMERTLKLRSPMFKLEKIEG